MTLSPPATELIDALQARIQALEATIAAQDTVIAKQEALLRKFQAMLFGPKSERGTPATPDAPPVAPDAPPAAPDTPPTSEPPPTEAPSPPNTSKPPRGKGQRGQRRGAPGHGRRLYEELPPREVLHALPEAERCCPCCGEAYLPAGTEDSTTIEWEVIIRRVIHRRQKYQQSCACGQAPGLRTAPPAPKLIPKGLLEVSAVANLVVNKFLHSQPIHRQLHELALLCGVRLAPGTLCGVQETVGDLLRPLYTATRDHLRAAHHWHADETRWMQYGDETKHRWWLWVFASHDAVVFALDPSRSRAVPRRVFGFDDAHAPRVSGILNCDRWKSYQGLAGLACAFCWAHVRRDFLALARGYPALLGTWAGDWVHRIGHLYHLHRQRHTAVPGTEPFRQADLALRDHVETLKHACDTDREDATLLHVARDALDSLTRHWTGLTLFLDHPEVPLDNNEAERLLRTSVVGRKNFYGSGSLSSGQLAECAYTVLLTALRNGLNPLTYLRAYLDACAQHGGKAPDDINRFLPWTATPTDRAIWTAPPCAA